MCPVGALANHLDSLYRGQLSEGSFIKFGTFFFKYFLFCNFIEYQCFP